MTVGDDTRNALRALARSIRAIPGRDFGIRPYRVFVVRTSWTGPNAGEGTVTVTTTEITEADGQPPKVRQLTNKELAIGGLPNGTLEVGPVTPDFPGGGTTAATLVGGTALRGELFHYMLRGPNSDDAKYELVATKFDRAFGYRVTLSPMSPRAP